MSENEPQQPGQQPLPTVPEVILSSTALLVSLGARAIAEGDLDEAQLAIDSLTAQMPLLERVVPADALLHYRQALVDLQLGYAQALHPAAPSEPQEEPVVDVPKPKIWTPGGEV